MEALGHRAEHLAQADRLRRREAERPHHLLLGQPEAAAARRRGAEHAGRAGDVPAAVVVRGVDGVADAAFRFDAEHHRVEEVAPGHRAMLREREERRDDRPGRMDDGLQVRVVEVEHVRADAVHQRRVQDVQPLAAAEHRGLRGSRERRERGDRRIERLVTRAADRAAHPVEQRALRFLPDRLGKIVVAHRQDVAGERSGHVSGCGRRSFGLACTVQASQPPLACGPSTWPSRASS